jgi:hypothetical protein
VLANCWAPPKRARHLTLFRVGHEHVVVGVVHGVDAAVDACSHVGLAIRAEREARVVLVRVLQ